MKKIIGRFLIGVIEFYQKMNRVLKRGRVCHSSEALGGSCSTRVLRRIKSAVKDEAVLYYHLPWLFWEIYWQEIGDCQGTSGVLGCGPHGTPRPPSPDKK